jgi:uncharacterized membrane protein YidH (DUF202 family)
MINKMKLFASSATFALVPFVAAAQFDPSGGEFGTLLGNIIDFTNDILIPFILGIGFLVFVWGMFRYFIAGGANDEAKEQGKSLMVYATLGFVLIIVFWGIVNLLAQSTGLDDGDAIGVIPNDVGL